MELGQAHVQGATASGPKAQDEWVPGALGDVTLELLEAAASSAWGSAGRVFHDPFLFSREREETWRDVPKDLKLPERRAEAVMGPDCP